MSVSQTQKPEVTVSPIPESTKIPTGPTILQEPKATNRPYVIREPQKGKKNNASYASGRGTSPKTGDDNFVTLWIMLMIISILAILVAFGRFLRKRSS